MVAWQTGAASQTLTSVAMPVPAISAIPSRFLGRLLWCSWMVAWTTAVPREIEGSNPPATTTRQALC